MSGEANGENGGNILIKEKTHFLGEANNQKNAAMPEKSRKPWFSLTPNLSPYYNADNLKRLPYAACRTL